MDEILVASDGTIEEIEEYTEYNINDYSNNFIEIQNSLHTQNLIVMVLLLFLFLKSVFDRR